MITRENPVPEIVPPPVVVRENGRSKSTINLRAALNTPKQEEKIVAEKELDKSSDVVIGMEKLREAWQEFAELRKHQIAEYNLLKKEFSLDGAVITLVLSNPIEEPLLQNIRVQLTAHLRNRLNNNSISVASIMLEKELKKVAYTDKEKFDLLAEKNPALRELKERFGLDSDF